MVSWQSAKLPMDAIVWSLHVVHRWKVFARALMVWVSYTDICEHFLAVKRALFECVDQYRPGCRATRVQIDRAYGSTRVQTDRAYGSDRVWYAAWYPHGGFNKQRLINSSALWIHNTRSLPYSSNFTELLGIAFRTQGLWPSSEEYVPCTRCSWSLFGT